MRRAVAAVGAAVLVGAMALSNAVPASAHAEVESSSPRNGAVVPTPPTQVRVTFGEDVTLDSARLVGPTGSALASAASIDGAVLTITPKAALPRGPITAAWHVVSDDGHPVSGAIAFVVGSAPRTGPAQRLTAFPRVPTTLSGTRPGALTLTLGTSGVGSDVEWTSPSVPEPITWRLSRDGRTVAGRGVLPVAGTWSFTATVVKKGGAAVVVTGTAVLRGGAA